MNECLLRLGSEKILKQEDAKSHPVPENEQIFSVGRVAAGGRDGQEMELARAAWGRSQRGPNSKARGMKTMQVLGKHSARSGRGRFKPVTSHLMDT